MQVSGKGDQVEGRTDGIASRPSFTRLLSLALASHAPVLYPALEIASRGC